MVHLENVDECPILHWDCESWLPHPPVTSTPKIKGFLIAMVMWNDGCPLCTHPYQWDREGLLKHSSSSFFLSLLSRTYLAFILGMVCVCVCVCVFVCLFVCVCMDEPLTWTLNLFCSSSNIDNYVSTVNVDEQIINQDEVVSYNQNSTRLNKVGLSFWP